LSDIPGEASHASSEGAGQRFGPDLIESVTQHQSKYTPGSHRGYHRRAGDGHVTKTGHVVAGPHRGRASPVPQLAVKPVEWRSMSASWQGWWPWPRACAAG